MNISELNVRQGNVEVEGTIKEIGDAKNFNKFGKELKVADAILEDSSDSIKLSLWNEDVDRFKTGDKIKISNGYVNEFQGEKQLTSGKFGKIEKVGDGSESSDSSDSQSSEGLSDNVAEQMGEDVADDASIEESVKTEGPKTMDEEAADEATETLEDAKETTNEDY